MRIDDRRREQDHRDVGGKLADRVLELCDGRENIAHQTDERRYGSEGRCRLRLENARPGRLVIPIAVGAAAFAQAKPDQHAPPGAAKRTRGEESGGVIKLAFTVEPEWERLWRRERGVPRAPHIATAMITAPMRAW